MTANATSHAAPGPWERFADLATLALGLAWLARLAPQALAARLQTDECFHAWVARWVSVHGALPDSVPGLYGGFAYFYPPLFHLVGGLAATVGGPQGLLLVNVAVSALLLLVVARGVRRLGVPAAARWAVALCVATRFLALHSVLLYAEDLSTLLVTAVALRLALLLRAPRAGDAVALGLAAGLAIVAKLSALVLLSWEKLPATRSVPPFRRPFSEPPAKLAEPSTSMESPDVIESVPLPMTMRSPMRAYAPLPPPPARSAVAPEITSMSVTRRLSRMAYAPCTVSVRKWPRTVPVPARETVPGPPTEA